MIKKNIVFIARSLDGFIADKKGGLDWLYSIPNPDGIDMGYNKLIAQIDAIVMGRTTFDVVCGFDGVWPYTKHVFVLSHSLKVVPKELESKVSILQGSPESILEEIHRQGFYSLYIDGGRTVQDFLRDDLIDEMIITTIPILLGAGFPLFGELEEPRTFKHIESSVFLGEIVQDHYRRS